MEEYRKGNPKCQEKRTWHGLKLWDAFSGSGKEQDDDQSARKRERMRRAMGAKQSASIATAHSEGGKAKMRPKGAYQKRIT